MKPNLQSIFNAGRVRRWHSNPDMSWTDDYNDGHQGRVARIILALHPHPSTFLLSAALTHDDGELAAGDMCHDAKRENPELRAMIQKVEDAGTCNIWGISATPCSRLLPDEREWLKFADQLDSYMWMMYRKPALSMQTDWIAQYERLREFAIKHEIWDTVRKIF